MGILLKGLKDTIAKLFENRLAIMRISDNIANLKIMGIKNPTFELLEDFPALSKFQVLKSLNAGRFTFREIKISFQKIRISKSPPSIYNSCFHCKISGKYNILKRSGRLFSDLIYSKLIAIDLTSINTIILKGGDCFSPHFYLISDSVRENKTKIIDKNSANISSISYPEYIVWKRLTVSDTVSGCTGDADSPCLISYPRTWIEPISCVIYSQQKKNPDIIYEHLEAGISDKHIFQESLKLSSEEKKPLKQLKSDITDRDPETFEIISKNKNIVTIRNSLNYPGSLRNLHIISRNFEENVLKSGNFYFSKSVKLHRLKPNFLEWKLEPWQKSGIRHSDMDKTRKVVPSTPQETIFLQKSINMEHLDSVSKDRVPYGVEVWNPGNFIGNAQDLVLRQSAKTIPEESSRYIEESVPVHALKQNTPSLSEENSFSAVSPRDINAIVDRVYRLLETKLLIEKERRGLR